MSVTINRWLCAGLLIVSPTSAHAFYETDSVELRGLILGSAATLRNIDNPLLYSKKNVSGAGVSGRLMLDATISNNWSFEMHAAQDYLPLELRSGGARFASLADVERSAMLDWRFDRGRSHLLIDRLNLQYADARFSLKAGRQPVNLAATFYFTPNDFFAPFAATTFFRDYKPGMDAVRADLRTGELGQLSLITVFGYRAVANSDNGWSNRIDAARNAYLARASAVFGDFECALLTGVVKKDRVLGGDFQGELFDWLGVRGEGHLRWPDAAGARRTVELAISLEHRWESSLTLRIEGFYHGAGSHDPQRYALVAGSRYLGRLYSAAGASYEFTPLLTGDVTLLRNWDDDSMLAASYLRYSLSDESELAVSATLSQGKRPSGAQVRSEFGLTTGAASLEYRLYF